MSTKEYPLLKYLIRKMNSRSSDLGKYQYNVGAIIADKKGYPISIGFNSYIKTHPKQFIYNKRNPTKIFLHAEIDALIRCRAEPYMMIICRLGKDGKIRMSRPCSGCYNAIKDVKLQKIYYTNNHGELVLLDNSITVDEYTDYCDKEFNHVE